MKQQRPDGPMRNRVLAFVGVCVVAIAVAAGALIAANRQRADEIAAAEPVSTVVGAAADFGEVEDKLLFVSTSLGDGYGQVGFVPLDASSGARAIADLACERVDYLDPVGVCLQADRGFITTYRAKIFDENFVVQHDVGLAGTPSRVRIAPDGAMAGVTVFVSGHSYADTGFSTQTILLDLRSGAVVADLETDFEVRNGDTVWRESDFNFWGVTFVDGETFYATLGTGGEVHLVLGDVTKREMTVMQSGVECPSLSPDGTRLAFKAREGTSWFIEVLELATGDVTSIAESRSVDDQVAWLDDNTLMYGLPDPESAAVTDTWTVPADGSGVAERLVSGAWSPRVVP